MANSLVLLDKEQIATIEQLVRAFLRLPFFEGVPGKVMEKIHAHVHSATVLGTYDFIDIVDPIRRIGWQVKSTQKSTPVTWKRAKIPAKEELIDLSRQSKDGRQRLGNAIIDYCNDHAIESIRKYNLQNLVYARLIDRGNGLYTYFERPLPISGILFVPDDFEWNWSVPKENTKKEQLPAFHGIHAPTGKPFFAWHGLGENQLHFKGEYTWWPDENYLYQINFRSPSTPLSLTELLEILATVSN